VIARPGSAIKSRLAPAAVRFARYRLSSREARLLPLAAPPAWLYMRAPLNFSSSSAIRAGGLHSGR
jgi:nicotinate-nucleotide adenylyltransferase